MKLNWILGIICVIIMILYSYFTITAKIDCNLKNGTLVRGIVFWECIKNEK